METMLSVHGAFESILIATVKKHGVEYGEEI